MSPSNPNPLSRLAHHPPAETYGGITFDVHMEDDRRGDVTVRQGDVAVTLRAAGLTVPYPSGLTRLQAADPHVELVAVDRVPAGLTRAAKDQGLSCIDVHGRGRIAAPGFVYAVRP